MEVVGIWVEFQDAGLDDLLIRVRVHREKKDFSDFRSCASSEVYTYFITKHNIINEIVMLNYQTLCIHLEHTR